MKGLWLVVWFYFSFNTISVHPALDGLIGKEHPLFQTEIFLLFVESDSLLLLVFKLLEL